MDYYQMKRMATKELYGLVADLKQDEKIDIKEIYKVMQMKFGLSSRFVDETLALNRQISVENGKVSLCQSQK